MGIPNPVSPIWHWFRNNQPPINAVSSIFAALGVCVAAGSLWFASNQFSQTVKSLQASTVYNLQKDARELLTSIRKDDPEVYRYIIHNEKGAGQDEGALYQSAIPSLTLLIQYYSEVFNQRQIGSIPDQLWNSMSVEMCSFFQSPPVKRFWKERVTHGRYDQEFKAFGQKCVESN